MAILKTLIMKKERIELENIGKELKLNSIALTFVPSFSDNNSEVNFNKINPEVENTIMIYRNRNIIDKFINIKPTQKNFDSIIKKLDETQNEFFKLKEVHN